MAPRAAPSVNEAMPAPDVHSEGSASASACRHGASPGYSATMSFSIFAARRAQLAERLRAAGGGVALLPTAPAVPWDALMVQPQYMQALDWI